MTFICSFVLISENRCVSCFEYACFKMLVTKPHWTDLPLQGDVCPVCHAFHGLSIRIQDGLEFNCIDPKTFGYSRRDKVMCLHFYFFLLTAWMGFANVVMKHTGCAELARCCRKGIAAGSAGCGCTSQLCYLTI